MKQHWIYTAMVLIHSWLPGCSKPAHGIDSFAHRAQIEEWRQERLARLTSETGWLTVCGLFWLKQGPNRCGSDSSNEVIFPRGKAPALVGTFWRTDTRIRFGAHPGVETRSADSLVISLVMKSDNEEGGPTILTHGSLSFYIIKRRDSLGVRVKDKKNPARVAFKGLEYFPIDLMWRIQSKFEPYTPPRVLQVPSVVKTVEDFSCPGALVFEHDGKTYRLDAVVESGSEQELFIMFSDQTNGGETYGGGRQLYTDLPDTSGIVVLDFNKAYNWPCVFSKYATCPIPPPQNHLPFRVIAGEKTYAGHQPDPG